MQFPEIAVGLGRDEGMIWFAADKFRERARRRLETNLQMGIRQLKIFRSAEKGEWKQGEENYRDV